MTQLRIYNKHGVHVKPQQKTTRSLCETTYPVVSKCQRHPALTSESVPSAPSRRHCGPQWGVGWKTKVWHCSPQNTDGHSESSSNVVSVSLHVVIPEICIMLFLTGLLAALSYCLTQHGIGIVYLSYQICYSVRGFYGHCVWLKGETDWRIALKLPVC